MQNLTANFKKIKEREEENTAIYMSESKVFKNNPGLNNWVWNANSELFFPGSQKGNLNSLPLELLVSGSNKSSWVGYFLQKAGTWWGSANHAGRHSEIPGTPSGSRLRTGYKHKTSIHQLLWPIGQQKGRVHHHFVSAIPWAVSVWKRHRVKNCQPAHTDVTSKTPKHNFFQLALFTMQREPYTDVLLPYYFTLFNHRKMSELLYWCSLIATII